MLLLICVIEQSVDVLKISPVLAKGAGFSLPGGRGVLFC
ncbi:MAG: hypothetical protein GQF41_2006 [Candidatus Rifleibacterium amylolyticum]|nr:MAG: hypothetical protein GQF41_2006 [Candidatus Rifleibacterium amylolyticum]